MIHVLDILCNLKLRSGKNVKAIFKIAKRQRLKKMYSDYITEIFCIPVNFDYILRHVDYYTGILKENV